MCSGRRSSRGTRWMVVAGSWDQSMRYSGVEVLEGEAAEAALGTSNGGRLGNWICRRRGSGTTSRGAEGIIRRGERRESFQGQSYSSCSVGRDKYSGVPEKRGTLTLVMLAPAEDAAAKPHGSQRRLLCAASQWRPIRRLGQRARELLLMHSVVTLEPRTENSWPSSTDYLAPRLHL